MLEMTEYGMRSTESVKTSFNCLFCPKDSILIRLRVFHFVPPYTCSVLNCLSQFETLHYPWIPSYYIRQFFGSNNEIYFSEFQY
jgi:hypothetical protein